MIKVTLEGLKWIIYKDNIPYELVNYNNLTDALNAARKISMKLKIPVQVDVKYT